MLGSELSQVDSQAESKGPLGRECVVFLSLF